MNAWLYFTLIFFNIAVQVILKSTGRNVGAQNTLYNSGSSKDKLAIQMDGLKDNKIDKWTSSTSHRILSANIKQQGNQ